MPWPLNNIKTENEYSKANTLEGGPGNRAVLDVYNQSVYVQLLTAPNGEQSRAKWTPERFIAPGSRTFPRKGIFGIRVRSAVKGKAAQVTMEIVGANE